jgi:hypothetical protein
MSEITYNDKGERLVSKELAERVNAFMARTNTAKPTRASAPAADTEGLLDLAIHQGAISSGLRAHFQEAFRADARGAREYLAALGVRAEGTSAVPTALDPSELPDGGGLAMSDAERVGVENARAGKRPSVVNGGL